jgi:hypothetical protein
MTHAWYMLGSIGVGGLQLVSGPRGPDAVMVAAAALIEAFPATAPLPMVEFWDGGRIYAEDMARARVAFPRMFQRWKRPESHKPLVSDALPWEYTEE